MSYKNILVHIDDSKACVDRVSAAIALAKRQDAQVTGIALALESTISTYVGIDIPSSLTQEQQEFVRNAAKSAVAKFKAAAKAADVESVSRTITCSASMCPGRRRLNWVSRGSTSSITPLPGLVGRQWTQSPVAIRSVDSRTFFSLPRRWQVTKPSPV